MPRITLTRRVYFSAAHRYRRPEWDDAKNTATFGLCARELYHGHTYTCDVTVAGALDPLTGFVADLGVLDTILQREVREPLDHRNLNLEVAEFGEGKAIPSSENLAAWIAERVQRALGAAGTVQKVVVQEEPHLWATWEQN